MKIGISVLKIIACYLLFQMIIEASFWFIIQMVQNSSLEISKMSTIFSPFLMNNFVAQELVKYFLIILIMLLYIQVLNIIMSLSSLDIRKNWIEKGKMKCLVNFSMIVIKFFSWNNLKIRLSLILILSDNHHFNILSLYLHYWIIS